MQYASETNVWVIKQFYACNFLLETTIIATLCCNIGEIYFDWRKWNCWQQLIFAVQLTADIKIIFSTQLEPSS